MQLFRKSGNDVVNKIGRKSAIPSFNFGSKLRIGNKPSQNMDEYGEENQKPKSDLEKHHNFEVRHRNRR
jgi:hypothetical protein